MKVDFLNLQQVNSHYRIELLDAITRVFDSGWYLRGEETRLFECEFASFCHAAYAVGVGNGLDALTLILMVCKDMYGWHENDEVLVPAHTFIATIQAVFRAGLKPVLCDVSESDYLMDLSHVDCLVTSRTRVILPVHLYGKVCNMPAIAAFAKQKHLAIIEDAAQAHGSLDCMGNPIGTYSNAVAYSFYPGKNLGALGDAGAVVTNDENIADRVRFYANYGSKVKYYHEVIGLNSRLDELQAACLRVKLHYLNWENKKRKEIAQRYGEGIVNPFVKIPYQGNCSESVFHIYPLLCEKRDSLQSYLKEQGIETLIHYPIPLHKQKALKNVIKVDRYPVTELICDRELSLPISGIMPEEEVNNIVESINKFER